MAENSTDPLESFLAHYGVRGMKWGVVKSQVSKLGPQRSRKEQNLRTQRKDQLKRRRTLSDKDLNNILDRMNKEKRVKELIQEDLSPGKTFIKSTLRKSGAQVAGVVATGVLMYGIRGALTKKWGLGDLASNIPKIKGK